jgi:hypothetical protein
MHIVCSCKLLWELISFFCNDSHFHIWQVATIAWFEADSICGSHSIAIPLVLVFPYLCRFFQCLRQYKDTKEKSCLLNGIHSSCINFDNLFAVTCMFILIPISQISCSFLIRNPALKYSTAVPVIFLSALKYHVFPEQWVSFYRPLWLISSVINSLYSFYWDIKRDWDLRCGTFTWSRCYLFNVIYIRLQLMSFTLSLQHPNQDFHVQKPKHMD